MNNPELMSASEFRRMCFPQRPPTLRTIIAWVDAGELPGYRVGRRVYVDVSRLKADIGLPSTGNPEADREADARAREILRGG